MKRDGPRESRRKRAPKNQDWRPGKGASVSVYPEKGGQAGMKSGQFDRTRMRGSRRSWRAFPHWDLSVVAAPIRDGPDKLESLSRGKLMK